MIWPHWRGVARLKYGHIMVIFLAPFVTRASANHGIEFLFFISREIFQSAHKWVNVVFFHSMCAHVHTNTRSTEIYKDFVGHFEWRHPVFNCETQSLITWQIWKKRWLNAFQSAQCCGVKFRGIGMIAGIYCKTVQHYGYVVLVSKGIEPGASSNEVCWGNIILCVSSVQKNGTS